MHTLKGEISIQGSKNAALPMMAAALLHKGLTVLTNVPRIQDTACMMKILEALGCSCIRRGCSVFIDAGEIKNAGASGICPVHAFIHYSIRSSSGPYGAGELLLSRRLSDRSKAHRSPSYGVK